MSAQQILPFLGALIVRAQASDSNSSSSDTITIVGWRWEYVKYPFVIAAVIILLCLVKIGYQHARKLSHVVPESCFLIVLGLLIGAFFLIPGLDHLAVLKFLSFNSQSFFLYLLPPIILEAAYSLKNRSFVDNLGSILFFAIIGTIINIFLVGFGLIGFHVLGAMKSLHITALGFFVFSSLIAAVDPVAVLAIFQDIGVNLSLYFTVFGESLFNDAITVVMFNLMVEYAEIGSVSLKNGLLGVCSFFVGSICSVTIGVLCGFATAWITKHTMKIRVVEPILIVGLAYFSYILAELFHFSGIIAIICCGLTQSHYAFENISAKSYISVHNLSKVMASVTESLIFIILGVMLIHHAGFWDSWNWEFSLSSLFLVIFARFLVIFTFTFIKNYTNPVKYSSLQEQFIIAYGGLRGAIAFALAFSLDEDIVPERDALMCATYFIVLFSIFVQGISMKPLVGFLEIKLKTKKPLSIFQELNHALYEDTLAGVEEIIGERSTSYWTAAIKHVSQNFIRPRIQIQPHKSRQNIVTTATGASLRRRIFGAPGTDVVSPVTSHLHEDTILLNVFGDELLEVCDERKVRAQLRLKKKKTIVDHPVEVFENEARRKLTYALARPIRKTLAYKAFDRNLTTSDSSTNFEMLNVLGKRIKKAFSSANLRAADKEPETEFQNLNPDHLDQHYGSTDATKKINVFLPE